MGTRKQTTATPPAAESKPEGKQEDVLLVTSAQPRRRGGRRFGPAETVIREGDLTEEELKALDDDPHISIRPGVRTFADED